AAPAQGPDGAGRSRHPRPHRAPGAWAPQAPRPGDPRQDPRAGDADQAGDVLIAGGLSGDLPAPTMASKKKCKGGAAMKLPRRTFLQLAAGAAALPAVSRTAMGQAYPTRPVRIIVGLAPGGGTDIVARLIGQWLSERLGQAFVIENRPRAAGHRATEAVGNAPADGYTLLAASPGAAVR